MLDNDFYGTTLDFSDFDQLNRLIFNPLDDAIRVMHTFSCTGHDNDVDMSATVKLISEEVRAVAFIVPHWCKMLPSSSVKNLPTELPSIIDGVAAAAKDNKEYDMPVPDAQILFPTISALDVAVQYIHILSLTMRMGFSNDDSES